MYLTPLLKGSTITRLHMAIVPLHKGIHRFQDNYLGFYVFTDLINIRTHQYQGHSSSCRGWQISLAVSLSQSR